MADPNNTLGAPTEGLGQKVTFAFQNGSGVPTQNFSDIGRIRAGVSGGGVAGGQTRATEIPKVQESATMQIIQNLAGPILQNKLKQAKTEAYVVGMQRAMAGEAVSDIAQEQPWYSKIFGDSDVVEGARAYSGQAAAQTAVGAMEDRMEEVRKLGPQEAQRYFVETVNKHLTGDKAADASVLQAFGRALPGVMRRQAKEHYGFLQENATAEEHKAFNAGAASLQRAGAALQSGDAGYNTPDEYKAQVTNFVRSLQPAAGRDPVSYKRSMQNNLVSWASNGQFHAINALRDSGFFDVLDVEQRTAVEKAVDSGESRMRGKFSLEWNDDLAKIRAQAEKPLIGQTSADIGKLIDGLNGKYLAATGSRSGLVTPEQRASLLSGSAVTISRAYDANAKKAADEAARVRASGAKADADAIEDAVIAERAGAGTLGTLSSVSGYGRGRIDPIANRIYNALPPDKQEDFLVNNMREDYHIAPVQAARVGSITTALQAGAFDEKTQAAFDAYARLRDKSVYTADKYYGPHATQLEGMYNAVKNGAAPSGAFREWFVNGGKIQRLSKEELKEGLEAVTSEYNTFLPEYMGGTRLKPGQARRFLNEIAGPAERMAAATNGDYKGAVVRVARLRLSQDIDAAGGYVWANSKGQQKLTAYLTKHMGPGGQAPVATDKVNEVVSDAVEELLYGNDERSGLTPNGILDSSASDISIIRMPDAAGVPRFHVQAVVDGDTKEGVLSAGDMYALWEKRRKRITKAKPAAPAAPARSAEPPRAASGMTYPSIFSRKGWAD